MKPTDFFRALSKANNYLPEETVKKFYDSMITIIRQEVRENGKITLPKFGKFWLTEYKERPILDPNTGQRIFIEKRNVLRFQPIDELKKYFNFD